MTDQIEIQPCNLLDSVIRPPGSKSITNRALICAALAAGPSRLTGALDSEDTQVMVKALQQLGLNVTTQPQDSIIEIDGCGGRFPNQNADLFVGNSGTTIRFLSAALATTDGNYTNRAPQVCIRDQLRQRRNHCHGCGRYQRQ